MANEEQLSSHAKKRKRQGNGNGETMKRKSAPGSYRNKKRAIARGRQSKSRIEKEPFRDDSKSIFPMISHMP